MSGQLGNIDIQPAGLRDLANQIGQQRDNLTARFDDIQKQMNNLQNDGWKSQSGEQLKTKFGTLRKYYDDRYPPAMNSYIAFLNKTADDYEMTEEKRKQDVEKLKTSADPSIMARITKNANGNITSEGKLGFQNKTDYYYENKDKNSIKYKEWGNVDHKEKKSFLDQLKEPKITLYEKDFFKDKEYVWKTLGIASFGYFSPKANFAVTNKGVEGEIGGKLSAIHLEKEKDKLLGIDRLSGKGQVDVLTAEVKLKGEVDLSKGKASVEAGAMASVATAKGDVTLDLGIAKIKLGGNVSALSAGAAAKGEVDLKDGKFGFSAGAGVGWFGGGVDVGVQLDYEKIYNTGKAAVDTVQKGAEAIGETIKIASKFIKKLY